MKWKDDTAVPRQSEKEKKTNGKSKDENRVKEKSKDKKNERKIEETSSGLKKQTRLGLEFRKDENLSEWYSQVKLVHFMISILVTLLFLLIY